MSALVQEKNRALDNFHGDNYLKVKKLFKRGKNYGFIRLPLFAVYENPDDFKGKYVVRLWQINRSLHMTVPTRYIVVKDTLEEVREALPPGLYRLGEESSDDPEVIEVWI